MIFIFMNFPWKSQQDKWKFQKNLFKKFCEIFNLPLKKEDRFDISGVVFNKLINMFGKLTLDEIIRKVGDEDICLTPVE